ncbi:penicillin-binding protein 1A [Desulfomonile tiedjei]|uniref:peptidoglycan glycosyltransferase n=1 Tax=Desulfomonile tiedjei (strain ATCC 49306 / DSM 6799 / DCB-1) TaxID=706587 RepID=I4C624_DESTA|nr:PBP1A family penicillin-binding protein [Desulfomonile tiedjei]AFM25015.1 penicillin-binding protein, 1A family [Desulfomonile tiedjei DSM 6799]
MYTGKIDSVRKNALNPNKKLAGSIIGWASETAKAILWLVVGIPILVACGILFGTAGILAGSVSYFSVDLPQVPDLLKYRPKAASLFYAEDGTVIGMFCKEKRFPIKIEEIPVHVIYAFIAAEDVRFFLHHGVDAFGIFRAFLKNAQAGDFNQGGSTITQQVTRNLLLSREKKVSRKIREALLAFRIEKGLRKEQILDIYLNEIYLGKGAYGVEAAARTYFGKRASELTLGEGAFLAALVSNPSRLSKASELTTARSRRDAVLDRMARHGFIDSRNYRMAVAEKLVFRESLPNTYEIAPYFAETVRQYVLQKYGEEKLYTEGLHVWTTCDLKLQEYASGALMRGLRAWESRHKRSPGLVKQLSSSESAAFFKKKSPAALKKGDFIHAMITKVHGQTKNAKLPGTQEYTVALAGNIQVRTQLPSEYRYQVRDVLEFQIVNARSKDRIELKHIDAPAVQGALVCMENNTGYVRALIGGTDFERSPFNRAVQAQRQPGSAFKPFVYAAALETGRYSPYSYVDDGPVSVWLGDSSEWWSPAGGGFYGSMILRTALAASRNAVAVKLLLDVGYEPVTELAGKMGIGTPLVKSPSLALGASEVTLFDLTGAYSVFPNGGLKIQPVLVKKITDRYGNVLEDNTLDPVDISRVVADYGISGSSAQLHAPEAKKAALYRISRDEIRFTKRYVPAIQRRADPIRVLSPQTSYLMVSMMHETCTRGTASAVTKLKRKDLCGKTGTTDGAADAWFVGFNSKYSTGVWVGMDTKVSLGSNEYGARAALPIWMDFMKNTLSQEPQSPYPVPEGIVFRERFYSKHEIAAVDLLEAGPDLARKGEEPQLEENEHAALASYGTEEADRFSFNPGFSVPMAMEKPPASGRSFAEDPFSDPFFSNQSKSVKEPY